MDAIGKWGSTIIVLINTIFGIVALLFLVAGCMVKYSADKIDDIAGSAISVAKEKLPDQATKYFDTENIKVSEFVGEAYVAFIAIGVVLLFIVIWAYCGTCCKSRWMLTIYAIILTAIILGQVAIVIIMTTNRNMIDTAIKNSMTKSLKMYKGGLGKDAPSRAWNAIMGLLHCCGVDGVADFEPLTEWDRHKNISKTETSETITLEAPYICCTNQTSTCPDRSFNNTNTYNGGCYDALWDLIESNKSGAIGIATCVGVFEIIMWFLTVWVIKELGKNNNKISPM